MKLLQYRYDVFCDAEKKSLPVSLQLTTTTTYIHHHHIDATLRPHPPHTPLGVLVPGLHFIAEHDVVVEVDPAGSEALDLIHVGLDGVRVPSGQVLLGVIEYFRVRDNGETRCCVLEGPRRQVVTLDATQLTTGGKQQ